jgi:hypothetical protein
LKLVNGPAGRDEFSNFQITDYCTVTIAIPVQL